MLRYAAETFFADSPVLAYPIAALLLFLVVFLVLTYRTFRGDAAQMERMARLPLEGEGDGETPRSNEP